MADAILHIKDSYYFEVPKFLAPAAYHQRSEFPAAWGKNDPMFQEWEFGRMYGELANICHEAPKEAELKHDWQHWQHADHANFAKPIHYYLAEARDAHIASFKAWQQAQISKAAPKDRAAVESRVKRMTVADFLQDDAAVAQAKVPQQDLAWFTICMDDGGRHKKWESFLKDDKPGQDKFWSEYIADSSLPAWPEATVKKYNEHLSGKILIPQPFGTLRNLYERESGFTISKFVVLEVGIGLVLILLFSWIAGRLREGGAPRGRLLNLMEVFLLYIRDHVARPAIGAHHDDHGDEHGHGGHGHDDHGGAPAPAHGHAKKPVYHSPWEQADSFVPLLWTMFFFILLCNLSGMVPWLGSPTGSWSVTLALCFATLAVVFISGMKQFGFFGFFANQVPSMDLPIYMAVVLKPMIFLIEMLGLMIKHLVLSIRLLANMVAGHLVILAFLGMAFGLEAAMKFTNNGTSEVGWQWYLTAVISIVGVVAINLLELMVAFLQAYIFTFLSALFIGAAVHKH